MANGVTKYGVANLKVYFPGGTISCGNCEFAYQDNLGRPRCADTKLVITDLEDRNYGCRLQILAIDEEDEF